MWVFDDSRITAAEARLQKRLCDGATPSTAGAARFELDPDALVAALAIARRRAGLPVEEAVMIDDELLDLTEIATATEAAIKASHAPAELVVEAEVVENEPEAEAQPDKAPALAKRTRKTVS